MRLEDLPPAALDSCGCGALVVWAKSDNDKPMMVERIAGVGGASVELRMDGATLRCRVVKASLAFGNKSLHLAHWVNCPDAERHRKVRRRSHAERRYQS